MTLSVRSRPKPPRYFGTVVPGQIYHWGDHMPHLGLEQVAHLGLEEKQHSLFGRCSIDDLLESHHRHSALLFDTYIDIHLRDPAPEKIFFPSYFLARCDDFRSRLGTGWSWNLDRSHDVACVMRQPRYARLIASCWLANHANHVRCVHTQNWEASERSPALYELLQIGGLKDWTGSWGPELTMLPESRIGDWNDGDAVDSFEMLYTHTYSRAAAAVVIGAVFWERASELCEKYLYAVYAGCVPLVQGYGVYDRLEALGFDVFADIINTDSQRDTNPIRAAWNLLDCNRDFLAHARDIQARGDIQRRLQANLRLAQDPQALFANTVRNLNTDTAQHLIRQHWCAIQQYFSWHDFGSYRP